VKVANFLYDLLVEADHHGEKGKEIVLALKGTEWCPGLERLVGIASVVEGVVSVMLVCK